MAARDLGSENLTQDTQLRDALKGNDIAAIRTARQNLEQAWQPVASALYSQAGANTGGGEAGPTDDQGAGAAAGAGDDVVDAEFHSSDES